MTFLSTFGVGCSREPQSKPWRPALEPVGHLLIDPFDIPHGCTRGAAISTGFQRLMIRVVAPFVHGSDVAHSQEFRPSTLAATIGQVWKGLASQKLANP